MVIGIYGEDSSHYDMIARKGEIPCRAFGEDCCAPYCSEDDTYSIISYGFLLDNDEISTEPLVVVHLSTMRRNSVHVFQQDSANTTVWKSVTNFGLGRSQNTIAFAGRKIVAVDVNNEVTSDDPNGGSQRVDLLLFTWDANDTWRISVNQTFMIQDAPLPRHHFLNMRDKPPMLSQDGSVLAITIVDSYMDRPVEKHRFVQILIYHWNDKGNSKNGGGWFLHRVVDLTECNDQTKNVVQIQMSGNGKRMILFQDDFSVRTIGI
uniref:Uncharacterized protein n=1 Tax=Amphora coffeiformis TaxID=265554 RepID=A0A7S3L4M3_9STRA